METNVFCLCCCPKIFKIKVVTCPEYVLGEPTQCQRPSPNPPSPTNSRPTQPSSQLQRDAGGADL